MAFNGGPMDGQPVTPEALSQVDQGGGLDLASLMQGMGGSGGPPGAGPPPDPGMEGTPQDDANMSETDRITRVLSDLMVLSSPQSGWSEQERHGGQQAMSILQKIKATSEKESEQAMSGKMSPRLLQKQYAGAGG